MSFQEQAEILSKRVGPGKPKIMAFAGLVLTVVVISLMAVFFFLQSSNDGIVLEVAPDKREDSSLEENSERLEDSIGVEEKQEKIVVHVGGSVNKPGVYELTLGDRVEKAIAAAGGASDGAVLDALNLARILQDGEQILVPHERDYETGALGTSNTQGISASIAPGKVNINTADVTQLDSLPGIGESTAQKIIADREANGPFEKVEDIQRVSGIGEKKYEQLAELISVG